MVGVLISTNNAIGGVLTSEFRLPFSRTLMQAIVYLFRPGHTQPTLDVTATIKVLHHLDSSSRDLQRSNKTLHVYCVCRITLFNLACSAPWVNLALLSPNLPNCSAIHHLLTYVTRIGADNRAVHVKTVLPDFCVRIPKEKHMSEGLGWARNSGGGCENDFS